ncbi:MAG TPA: WecB/TagA/CpsF family glycosyltransferase [Ktedonobacteraceae bacterium]|nr:WecB/TagA/CpsF family glycosyltransferase [Ktedonobacteraceae bacterium]
MTLQQLDTMPPKPVYVLGVRVDRVSQQQALDAMEQMIAHHRANMGAGVSCPACQQIITVNPEFVMAAQQNEAFREAINNAALVLADGTGVVWATRYLGKPTPERVTGIDTLPLLAQRCAAHGYRMYLLGAAPGVAEIAAARLRELAPGVEIAGTYAGSPAPEEEDAIIERVRAAGADVLCVAYGAPAQDLWIARNLARLPVAIAIGVGGAFDFLAGRQKRAPRAMQRMGIEWLYRLYREPSRWKRMLALPRFALQVVVKGRSSRREQTHHDA